MKYWPPSHLHSKSIIYLDGTIPCTPSSPIVHALKYKKEKVIMLFLHYFIMLWWYVLFLMTCRHGGALQIHSMGQAGIAQHSTICNFIDRAKRAASLDFLAASLEFYDKNNNSFRLCCCLHTPSSLNASWSSIRPLIPSELHSKRWKALKNLNY